MKENEIWSIGRNNSYIVSNVRPIRNDYYNKDFEYEKEYCGGYLIAESIPDIEKAKLMAASPELLEALKMCVNAVGAMSNESLPAHNAYIKAKQAIKKATE